MTEILRKTFCRLIDLSRWGEVLDIFNTVWFSDDELDYMLQWISLQMLTSFLISRITSWRYPRARTMRNIRSCTHRRWCFQDSLYYYLCEFQYFQREDFGIYAYYATRCRSDLSADDCGLCLSSINPDTTPYPYISLASDPIYEQSTGRTYIGAACATYYLMGGSEEDCTLCLFEI